MLNFSDDARVLAEFCAPGATLGILYNLVAAALVLRFRRPSEPPVPEPPLPCVSVLKPLHGGEPGLYPRLAAFCNQDYRERVQLVCGTQSPADHAIPTVRLLQKLNPDIQVDLVVDERSRGTNRKIANLINMEAKARHEVIVLSDS